MEIKYFDQNINSIKKSSKLNAGDLLVLPRNYFAHKSFSEGAFRIYRRHLKKKN